MLTVDLQNFAIELTEGSVKNVGAPNKSATVKLFDVDVIDVRAFGDNRVKLAFEDGEGNEVEIALSPDDARRVAGGIAELEDESPAFE